MSCQRPAIVPKVVKRRNRVRDGGCREGSAGRSGPSGHRNSPSRGAFPLSAAILASLSFFFAPVAGAHADPPAPVTPPTVAGTLADGQTLALSDGTWALPPDMIAVTWSSCPPGDAIGSPQCTTSSQTIVPGAGSTYALEDPDVGNTISATETPQYLGDPGTPQTWTATSPVVPALTGAAPQIGGTPQAGDTLRLTQGVWDDDASGVAVTDQWEDCNGTGADCAPIAGATGARYIVTRAEAGDTIEVLETATQNGASSSATTEATAVVTAVPVSTGAPVTQGAAQVGQTLNATTGSWTETPDAYAYQWSRCSAGGAACTTIAGATDQQYPLTDADVGDTIEVQVTASVDGVDGAPATSPPSEQIVPGVTTAPAVTGTARAGAALTLRQGVWDGGAATVTGDEWLRCDPAGACTDTGVAGTTYAVGRIDAGDTLEVTETATEDGATASTTSTPSGVATAVPVATGAPDIAGPAQSGQTLTATPGSWTESPTAYAYQWSRCSATGTACAAVPGATRDTYALADADVGFTLEVAVTASVDGTDGTPLSSAATPVISPAPVTTATTGPTAPVTTTTTGPTAPVTTPSPMIRAVTVSLAVASSAGVNGPTRVRVTVTGVAGPVRGTVVLRSGATTLTGCGAVAVASSTRTATATCTTELPGGTSDLTAAFVPAAGVALAASTSSAHAVVIAPAATRTALDAPVRATVGGRVTYTASVTPPEGRASPLRPAGTVRFTDHGTPIAGCGAVALSGTQATCTTRYRGAGAHRIAAAYDGDASFRASRSTARVVTLRFPSPVGAITARLSWTFHYTRRYTEIQALRMRGATAGSSVTLSCAGRGCPFHSSTRTVGSGGAVDLDGRLRDRQLAPGDTVQIVIRRLRYTGKYYRFQVRAGHPPVVRISCLAQGSDTPGAGCTGP